MTDIVERLRSIGGYFDVPACKIVSVAEAADEIERLRAEIAELRKAQGEPVAVVAVDKSNPIMSFISPDGRAYQWQNKDTVYIQPLRELDVGTPLYASAPSIPEGWQLVPIMPTKKMIENAHLAEHCGNTDWHFVRAYSAMLAAAPKYGE